MYNHQPIEPFGISVTEEEGHGSLWDLPPDELEQMVEENKVVVLRGFDILPEAEFTAVASRFGPLLTWEFGDILNLRIEKNPQNHLFTAGRVELHWDGAYIQDVPRFSLFQCLYSEAHAGGGETLFTNTVKLVSEASEDDRLFWSGVRINYRTDKAAHYSGDITVPLLGAHPYTQQPTIRYIEPYNEDNMEVNPVYIKVFGIGDLEEREFLEDFTARLYAPEVMYRHVWRRGDFLIYDNHALLHGRARIQGNVRRHLQRIHILDRP